MTKTAVTTTTNEKDSLNTSNSSSPRERRISKRQQQKNLLKIKKKEAPEILIKAKKVKTQKTKKKQQIKKAQQLDREVLKESKSLSETSLEDKGSKVQVNKIPPYYLHKVIKDIYSRSRKQQTHQKFLNHFNTLRKHIGLIKKIIQAKKPVMKRQNILPRLKKKTLVLDLDETLVHSFMTPQPFETTKVEFMFKGFQKSVFVKKRPYVDLFLKNLSHSFNITIFTASHQNYANKVIDLLDPDNNIISNRLFNRDCLNFKGLFLKSLDIFNVDPRDLIIVDNAVLCFGLDLANGVPIQEYRGEGKDEELIDLEQFLSFLSDVDDVRETIMGYFKWDFLMENYKRADRIIEGFV